MRILQVTQSYYPFLDRGGPAVKVRAMARGLTARGHAVTVLTADLGLPRNSNFDAPSSLEGLDEDRWGWHARESDQSKLGHPGEPAERAKTSEPAERNKKSELDQRNRASEPDERNRKVALETVYLATLAAYRALTWNPRLPAWCREHVPRFDVAHIFGFYDLFGPAAARACRRAGVPYVLEPMGMFRPIVRNIPLKRIYRRLLGDAMALGARRVIATSEQEQLELVEQGLPANHIVVRRNGIDIPDRLPPPGDFRRAWHIPPEAPIVLFLGRLVTKKSPELLLEAFAAWQSGLARHGAHPGARPAAVLVFAGPAETSAYQQELAARARRLGLDRQVLFTGPLYDDAKWSAYRDADVFVLPSQNENFGNAAAEAVACGTPALVTDCCGIAPLIAPPAGSSAAPRAGIVVPHDSAALAAALGRLLEADDLRDQLRQGCAAVAQSLDWTQPLDETEALYAELLSGRKSH